MPHPVVVRLDARRQQTSSSRISASVCNAMQYTPDGKYILFVVKGEKVVLWDVEAGESVEETMLGIEGNVSLMGNVSKDCRIVKLTDGKTQHVVHLQSFYY